MALRLLEVTIPASDLDAMPEVLEGIRVAQIWTSRPDEATGLVRILMDAHDAEALTDRLARRFEFRDPFRLMLFPVEATLPAVPEPEKKPETAADEGRPAAKRRARRISREELYEDLVDATRLTPMWVLMVALSTIVAAVGLIRGDVAIIIGAMVIAPLLGPNIALSLAATLGDPHLARQSLRATSVGVTTAGIISLLLGALLTVDPAGPEIASRIQPGIGDVILATVAGAAGALAFTTGVPAVVVGVMVAVALLPPLVVTGLLAGAGHLRAAMGALILVLTNVTCVNLAAVATFLLQRVRPRTWWEADRARKATRRAVTTWIVMLAVLLALMLSGYLRPM